MVRRPDSHPTELELLILHVLWDEAPLRVRDVRQRLEDGGRPLAHTSVITILNLMVEKRYLYRTKLKNAFFYQPRVSKDKVTKLMTQGLVDRVFKGSRLAIVQHLLDSADLNEHELAEIRKLIKSKSRAQS